MNKEFNGFDEMVEALEENEDMVECKECFELFPKVDCERSDIGYVCPVCRGLRTPVAQARFVDPYDSYTQDFPEVTEYDPDSVVEYEKEPGLGDALADLIKDEYEAIDGYEVADETVQHADIDENEKDEILDTLDHIKEEEEEHIDELKELCPDCDPEEEPKEEPTKESEEVNEKLEEAADDEATDEEPEVEEIPEEEAEDSEETENEEVSDLDSAYEAALEIANESGVGQVFGYARKETEEFVAIEPFEVDDPEAVEDDLMAVYDDVAYAYVAYPEKSLEEALFESVQLNEAPLGFLGIGSPAKLFDSFFSKANNHGGYQIKALNSGDGNKEETVDIPGIGDISKRVFNDYTSAVKAAKQASKLAQYAHLRFTVLPKNSADLNSTSATIKSTLEKLSKLGLTAFRKGNVVPVVQSQVDVAIKALKKAAKSDKKLARLFLDEADPEADNTDSEDTGDTGSDTAGSDAAETAEPEGEAETEEDEDPNLDDEDAVDLKDAAKKMLGEKKAADGYTPESYKKYEAAYAKILAWIEAHTKPEALTQERIDNLKNQAEAKLKEVEEVEDTDPDLSDDETEGSTETSTDTEDTKTDGETDDTTDETGDTTEEPADETPAEETTEITGEVKLSEVSEEQLKKLYTAVTGQGVGDNKKWRKVLARMRAKLQELGESLDPQDYKAEDFIEEELSSEAEVAKSLKDTQATLKSTADGLKNMTSAMREEYHKYANPAELTAMDNLRADVDKIVNQVITDLVATGYDDLDCYDSDCYMSGNNTCTITMFIGSEDTFEAGETEDLQDHMATRVEDALAQIKLPPEIVKIQGGAMFPDNLIMDDEDTVNGVTRGEITVEVTFARNLM